MGQFIAKQKARVVLLNAKAKQIGFSIHASVGDELHYGWWYIVADGIEPSNQRVIAICSSLDDVDAFLAEEKRQALTRKH